jgi:hypothetical protein
LSNKRSASARPVTATATGQMSTSHFTIPIRYKVRRYRGVS